MAARGIADDDQPLRVDAFGKRVPISYERVVLLRRMRMFGRQPIIRDEQARPEQGRQHVREAPRDARVKCVAAAVEIEQRGVQGQFGRRNPVALRGAG